MRNRDIHFIVVYKITRDVSADLVGSTVILASNSLSDPLHLARCPAKLGWISLAKSVVRALYDRAENPIPKVKTLKYTLFVNKYCNLQSFFLDFSARFRQIRCALRAAKKSQKTYRDGIKRATFKYDEENVTSVHGVCAGYAWRTSHCSTWCDSWNCSWNSSRN